MDRKKLPKSTQEGGLRDSALGQERGCYANMSNWAVRPSMHIKARPGR